MVKAGWFAGRKWRRGRLRVAIGVGLTAVLATACGSSSSSSSSTSSSGASSSAANTSASVKSVPFKLGYFITPSVNYYGIIGGFYKPLNMGLFSLDSGATAVTLMGAGSLAAAGYVSQPPTVIAFSKGVKVRVVWVEGYEPEYVIVKKGTTDLHGKTLAAQTGGAPQYFLQRYLQSRGIGASGYKYVNLTPPNVVSAFKAGAIDGAVSFPPYSDSLIKLGGVKIATSQAYGWDIFTQQFIDQHPAVVQAYVCASDKAQNAFLSDPNAAWKAMSVKLGTSVAQLESVMPVSSVLPPSQMFTASGLGSATTIPTLATSSASQGAWLVQQGAVPSAPTPQEAAAMVDRQFAENAVHGGCS
jgi:taurine transport system substrate-binding protein